MIVAVCLIAVDGQQREQADELQTLPQHIGNAGIVCPVVVGIQRQHAPRQRIHHVLAGRLHDDVTHKAGGKGAVVGQQVRKGQKLCPGGKLPEQEQVGNLLKTEALLGDEAVDQLVDVDAAVV